MIESEPTNAGAIYFIDAKEGIVTGEKKIGNNTNAMVFMGMPCNGKTHAMKILQAADAEFLGGENAAMLQSDKIRLDYTQAHSRTRWVERKERQFVYEELFFERSPGNKSYCRHITRRPQGIGDNGNSRT